MVVGFTGSSKGMTHFQKKRLAALLEELRPELARHGDCVGADAEFHAAATALGLRVCIHPPENEGMRAFCQGDTVLPAKASLERNKDIVDMSDLLIAAPKSATEELRSGTWATIRHARSIGRKVILLDASEEG
jgi:hypothetical protein